MSKKKPKKSSQDLFKETTMTFGEHLEELRICLWRAIMGLAVGFVLGLIIGGRVVDAIQYPLEKALGVYYQDQSAVDIWKHRKELRAAGYAVPEDKNQIQKTVADKRLMFEEVYINPGELLRRLKQSDPKQFDHVPLPDLDPKGKFNDNDLVPLYLWRPVDDEVRVTSLSAHEPFLIYIKASLLVGVLISSPWVFYQIWIFVAAGLYPHEKKYIHVFLPFSLALFFSGAALAFFFVFGPVLKFLFHFNEALGITQDIRISEWLGFVLMLPLGFGISFQLPLVMLFLERIGIFDIQAYVSKWRIAILVIFTLAMFLTPADPTSMILMAAPLTVLYFGGILLCKYMPRSRSPFEDEFDEQPAKQPADTRKPTPGRSLLNWRVAVAAALALLLVFGYLPWKKARRQLAAVAEIEQLGGKVYYDYQFDPSGKPIKDAQPPGPALLRNYLGENFFAKVVAVDLAGDLSGSKLEAVVQQLKSLSSLNRLDLSGAKVAPQAVEQLRQALPQCEIITGRE